MPTGNAKYHDLVKAGLCITCRKPRNNEEVRCADCHKRYNDRRRARESALKASGLCIRCRQNRTEEGKEWCESCSKRYNDRRAEQVLLRRKANLCPQCGQPNDKRRGSCSACHAKTLARERERAATGLCVDCGAPNDTEHLRCSGCGARKLKATNDKKRRLALAGRCPQCGKPSDRDGLYCSPCIGKSSRYSKDRSDTRRRQGLCVECGVPATAGQMCVPHWMKNVANNCLRSTAGAEVLARIWERQGGRCYYTGLPLTPAVNASVDHLVPVSKGGPLDAEDNLVWSLWIVNHMKGSLSAHEFLGFIKLIAAKRGDLDCPMETIEAVAFSGATPAQKRAVSMLRERNRLAGEGEAGRVPAPQK